MSNYKNEIRENVIRTYKALVDENYAPKAVEPVITVDNMAAIATAAEEGGGGGGEIIEPTGSYKLHVPYLVNALGDLADQPYNQIYILTGVQLGSVDMDAGEMVINCSVDSNNFVELDIMFADNNIVIHTDIPVSDAPSMRQVLYNSNVAEATIQGFSTHSIIPVFSAKDEFSSDTVTFEYYNFNDLFMPAN